MPHGYWFPVELPVITKGSRDLANAWTWNGSTEKPTLKPSIRTIHPDGKVSHVWLTDGVCQHLDDSTDGLAGQTLPLLPLGEIYPCKLDIFEATYDRVANPGDCEYCKGSGYPFDGDRKWKCPECKGTGKDSDIPANAQ